MASSGIYLGLDVGTQGTKVILKSLSLPSTRLTQLGLCPLGESDQLLTEHPERCFALFVQVLAYDAGTKEAVGRGSVAYSVTRDRCAPSKFSGQLQLRSTLLELAF